MSEDIEFVNQEFGPANGKEISEPSASKLRASFQEEPKAVSTAASWRPQCSAIGRQAGREGDFPVLPAGS